MSMTPKDFIATQVVILRCVADLSKIDLDGFLGVLSQTEEQTNSMPPDLRDKIRKSNDAMRKLCMTIVSVRTEFNNVQNLFRTAADISRTPVV